MSWCGAQSPCIDYKIPGGSPDDGLLTKVGSDHIT